MCAIMDEIREEGKEEGRWENKLEIAENLLKMGDSIFKVIQVTQLPAETVQTMAIKMSLN